MKMSTRGQYALEIAVDLALHLMPDRLESLNDIAKRRNLSEKYLERIMKLLKEAGLVKKVGGACKKCARCIWRILPDEGAGRNFCIGSASCCGRSAGTGILSC